MLETNSNTKVKNYPILKDAFKQYYFKNSKLIQISDRIEQREFGYTQFGQTGMIRHISFKNIGELIALLIREAPSDVYCSNACYMFPTSPIREKRLIGADLIFDIDGKDLNLPCVPSHSYPVCSNCGKISTPIETEFMCPSCNNKKSELISIPCNKCIAGSKSQVQLLIKLLIDEIGLEKEHISIFFSGNNGFHIHVARNAFLPIPSQGRLDIVNYLSGKGFMAESIGIRKDALKPGETFRIRFPEDGISKGWRKKISDKLKIDLSSEVRLKNHVLNEKGYEGFKTTLNKMTKDMGVQIDTQVTSDIHRIFRMPGTLNSKSGLTKVKCNNIDSFNIGDACLLDDSPIRVHTKIQGIKLKLRGKGLNISREVEELPAYAAVYLICKGLAQAG